MTNQEKGMAILVEVARQIVPPTLDFAIIIYRPDGEICMSSAITKRHGKTDQQQFERAKEAAQAFLTEKPRAEFNAQKN